jgi:hypothetical protein
VWTNQPRKTGRATRCGSGRAEPTRERLPTTATNAIGAENPLFQAVLLSKWARNGHERSRLIRARRVFTGL